MEAGGQESPSTNARDRRSVDGSEPIAFSTFRIDRRGGQLTNAGKPLPVRRKTWEVLLYLAERPGVLVTKSELLDAIWPNVAITPDVLIKSIRELRVALADDSRAPHYIETVHRRGYRFIAETHVSGSTTPVASGLPDEPESREPQAGAGCFVGRATELAQLEALFAKACTGQRQMVFVTGPAGIGKTALIEAFLDSPAVRHSALPVFVGRGCCVEQQGSREACTCVLDALARLARGSNADQLIKMLRRMAPSWLAQMPWLIDDAETLRQSLGATKPEGVLREFAALTEALTTDASLVLVLEDLHWSDATTIDLLSLLGQRREPARLLVIASYRPAEAVVHEHVLCQAVRRLQLRGRCIELPVHELPTEEVQGYLETRFPSAPFSSALARLLHSHTDGNPLFMVAVVEHMLSCGWILETAPGWSLSVPLEKIDLGLPENARRMIEEQFEALPPTDRELLEALSVAGGQGTPQVIAATLGLHAEDTEARCERLTRAHWFLTAAGNVEWPDGSVQRSYTFVHELYRQAVYAGIPDGQRRRLHQCVGEVLEGIYGDRATELATVLAAHFEEGGDSVRLLRYLAAAGVQARLRQANREAIAYLTDALACVARLPENREWHSRELELRLALAPALNDLYGFGAEPVRQNLERAADLCQEVGSSEQRFQILYALCHLYGSRADREFIPKLAAELNELAGRLDTPAHHLLTNSLLVRLAAESGRFVEACRLAEERLPVPPPQPVPDALFAYGADPLTAANCHYAFALWARGDTTRARNVMRITLDAGQASRAFSLAVASWFQALLEVVSRNADAAREPVERAAALATEQGFAFWSSMAAALRGWITVQDGRTREGIVELQQARVAHSATGARLFSTYILAFLAEAQLRAGDPYAGLAAIDKALSVADATLDRSYWPELWRLKGELLLATSAETARRLRRNGRGRKSAVLRPGASWSDAERCFLHAVELARNADAKSLELRAATSLARAWSARRRGRDAHALLSDVCGWFGPRNDSADLTEARTLLLDLSTQPSGTRNRSHRAPSFDGPLSGAI